MRLASESAEEEETRLSRRQSRDRARRAAQSSQATKYCRGSETAEARERRSTRDRDRRKRRLDSESTEKKDTRLSSETQMISLIQTAYIAYTNSVYIDNLAIIHVSSCNDVLALHSLATFSLHVHVWTTCFITHAAYFVLHVHLPIYNKVLAFQDVHLAAIFLYIIYRYMGIYI